MSMTARLAFAAIRAARRLPARRDLDRYGYLSDLIGLLRSGEIDCVIDVGANIGQFGHDLRRCGYKGWIVSFEPSPKDLATLRNRADSKWLSHSVALTQHDGEREFNLTAQSDLNSFLTPTAEPVKERVTVTTRRLDSMMDSILESTGARNLLLKCDTQGLDVEVVKGAGMRITDFKFLLSELSVGAIYHGMPTYLDALGYYTSLGFKLHSLHVVNRNPDNSVLEYDALLTR